MATNSAGTVYFDLKLNKGNFNKDVKNAARGADSAFNAAMGKIKGYVAGAFSVVAITKFTKASIDAASQMQSAWTGLKSIADGSDKSFAEAQKFIINQQEAFEKLDKETRSKFEYNPELYIAEMSNNPESWLEKMGFKAEWEKATEEQKANMLTNQNFAQAMAKLAQGTTITTTEVETDGR